MYAPLHADSGLTLSGSLTITPRLEPDDIELLHAIAAASLRSSLDDKRSTLVDTLAPGHPDGPNPGWLVPKAAASTSARRPTSGSMPSNRGSRTWSAPSSFVTSDARLGCAIEHQQRCDVRVVP